MMIETLGNLFIGAAIIVGGVIFMHVNVKYQPHDNSSEETK